MIRVTIAVGILTAFVMAVPAYTQTTWYVDDDAPNDPGPGDPMVSDPLEDGSAEHPFDAIQEGIDAAGDGDTVLVLDGTYTGEGNKNLDFAGKAISVRSQNGPDACVIDCEYVGRGFYFHSGETAASVLDGLTIFRGHAVDSSPDDGCGGGIYCHECSPTIVNCIITANTANVGGGGVYAFRGNPTISHCTFNGNAANNHGGGGGVFFYSRGSPTISDCTIDGNTAGACGGGGIWCYGSDAIITRCTISDNVTSNDDGGGVCCYSSSATVSECMIIGNAAGEEGGGVCTDAGNSAFINCIIAGNVSFWEGGGLCCMQGTATISNCEISGNSSSYYGGGICCFFDNVLVRNCTISGNSAADGGGLSCLYNSSAMISDSIVWGNAAQAIYVASGSNVAATYCDIQGGWAGTGNIDEDPLFVDPDGPDNDPDTWEDNDYHLTAGSPCRDAGHPRHCPIGLVDMDGEPRVMGVRVDMGADEVTDEPFVLLGDLDCDCTIDGFDIDAFVLALQWASQYERDYPHCDRMLADINGDGYVDGFDIDPFVDLLLGGG